MKLGVNIDHIATLRNARGQDNPSILRALKVCEKVKVDTLTVHLREDRRHINDSDLKLLKKHSRLPINLEMALTDEMILISKKIKPKFICLVPEKRNEITTEGGLNLEKISKNKLKSLLSICHSNGIELSAFINPNKKAIDLAKKLQSKLDNLLEKHCKKTALAPIIKRLKNINKTFDGQSIEEIFENLKAKKNNWSISTLKELSQKQLQKR